MSENNRAGTSSEDKNMRKIEQMLEKINIKLQEIDKKVNRFTAAMKEQENDGLKDYVKNQEEKIELLENVITRKNLVIKGLVYENEKKKEETMKKSGVLLQDMGVLSSSNQSVSDNPPDVATDSRQEDCRLALDACEEPQAVATSWENKIQEASTSKQYKDQSDVSSGEEAVVDSWGSEGDGPGSWDHHLQNEKISEDGYKDKRNRSREGTSDEPDSQSWRAGGNSDSRRSRSREEKCNCNLSRNDNYRSQDDLEFEEFWKFYKSHKKESFKKVKEIEENLFKMPPEYALAHCVAEDMAMARGIAAQFSQQFKSKDVLYQQRQKQGGLAVLTIKGRYIYYLVTKRLSNGKSTMHTMWSSLRKLQQHMEKNKVGKLAIPRIGGGLGRLEWSEVKAMIEYVFRNADVEVRVCNFRQNEDDSSASTQKGPRKCTVRNVAKPLVQIGGGTAIIYFGTEDGFVSEGIESLDTKFRIINDYKTAKRSVGEVVLNYKKNSDCSLYGFIINKRKEDRFDFVNLQKCLGHFKKQNRQDKYGYVAFEAFLDEDDLIVSKICSVLRYSLYDVGVYVCWPSKMVSFMPRQRQDDYY